MIINLLVSTDFLVIDHTETYTQLGMLDFCRKNGIDLVETKNRSQLVYDKFGDTGIQYLNSVYPTATIQVMSLKVKRVPLWMKNVCENLIKDNVILSYKVVKER